MIIQIKSKFFKENCSS